MLEQLLEKYPQSLKVVFKNYPLTSIHKFAVNAAVSALAAGRQGKFWAFHDALFEDYKNLNEEKMFDIVTRLELDRAKFEADRKDRELANRVNSDYQEGSQLGIRGVPTVFINGKQQRRWSPQLLEQAIEMELRKKK
jgi:protein-disulfide isomerase